MIALHQTENLVEAPGQLVQNNIPRIHRDMVQRDYKKKMLLSRCCLKTVILLVCMGGGVEQLTWAYFLSLIVRFLEFFEKGNQRNSGMLLPKFIR